MDYSKIYNNDNFAKGFSLIEEKSDEKIIIAQTIANQLKKLLPEKEVVRILDLAGGSGKTWKIIFEMLNDEERGKIEMILVDSSESQVEKAKDALSKFPFVKPTVDNAVDYIRKTKEQFDYITAIHFLPGLPSNLQSQVITYSLNQLNNGGMLLVVQPGEENQLTQMKVKLISDLFNEKYRPSYIEAGEIWTKPQIEIKSSIMKITEEELVYLGYFLLGKYIKEEIEEEKLKEIEKEFGRKVNEDWEFKIVNKFLTWRRG